ncbi:MAG: hypothetical protein ACR2P0_16055, partial [Acidimicrobiales bacterium]
QQVTLDVDALPRYLDRLEERSVQMRRLLGLLRFRRIHITYEDVVAGKSWDAISALLGASMELDRTSALTKLSRSARSDRVSNWDDVVSVLRHSRHAVFLT